MTDDEDPVDLWGNRIGPGARVRVSRQSMRGRVVSIAERMVDIRWDDGSKWCAGYHVARLILEVLPEKEADPR